MASSLFFPITLGLNWSIHRIPHDSVQVYESSSLKRVRVQYAQYPRWRFQLNYEFLRDDPERINNPIVNPYTDLEAVMGFFLDMGRFQSFLLDMSQITGQAKDAHVDSQIIGTGNGTQTVFQLVHAYGGGLELIQNVANLVVRVNGNPTSAYVLATDGTITFTTAPGASQIVDCDFDFYYRVCFEDDHVDSQGFMFKWYQMKQLQLLEDRY